MKPQALIIALLAAALALPLRAQNPEPPKAAKITLYPMAAPQPALKYCLLPSALDTRPGNAAVLWNRIPAERAAYFSGLSTSMEPTLDWMQIPVGDPRGKEFRAKHPEIAAVIRDCPFADMVRAARCESCDWQLPIHEGNIYEMSISEGRQLRTYGRLLGAKAHSEIAAGKYDQAVETMQTGFAMARDAAKGPFWVFALLGDAIAQTMTRRIEQFVQQPDAPNLYWALTTLPQPLIDCRLAFEIERNNLFLQFPDLRDLDKKDLSAEEWRALLEKTIRELDKIIGGTQPHPELEAGAIAIALQGYPMAKQYLIEHGRRAADVEAMPVAKVVLIYSLAVFQHLCDETFKASCLPYSEGRKWLQQGEQAVKTAASERREIIPLATELLPAVNSAKTAEARVPWIIARLRILEALRIYAAGHGGKLPDELEDITEVPIPINPFDGKPFIYHRDGNHAVLDCQHGPKDAPWLNLPWRYEITMLNQGEKP